MKYTLIILSLYLLGWNFLDFDMMTIENVKNYLPLNFNSIYITYIIFIFILFLIIEELINLFNLEKKKKWYKLYYSLPILIGTISVLISLNKLTNFYVN